MRPPLSRIAAVGRELLAQLTADGAHRVLRRVVVDVVPGEVAADVRGQVLVDVEHVGLGEDPRARGAREERDDHIAVLARGTHMDVAGDEGFAGRVGNGDGEEQLRPLDRHKRGAGRPRLDRIGRVWRAHFVPGLEHRERGALGHGLVLRCRRGRGHHGERDERDDDQEPSDYEHGHSPSAVGEKDTPPHVLYVRPPGADCRGDAPQ
jgi:hypothetical protein